MNWPILFRSAMAVSFAAALRSAPAESVGTYSLREWHGNNGLPNEAVQDVIQDGQGYLWVAAEGGLVRFNGIRFDTPPRTEKTPLPPPTFKSMVVHPELGVLFSSGSGELWQWSGNVLRKSPILEEFSRQQVATWFVQADGTLWAGFLDGRIACLTKGKLTEVKLDEVNPPRRPLSFADDGGGGMWIAAGTVLFHYRDGSAKQMQLPFDDSELRIAASKHGNLWVITRDAVGRWNGQAFDLAAKIPELFGAHFVRNLLEDRDGKLWVATRSQGAYVVAGGRYQPVPTSHRTINSLCQDTEGNIWLATGGGGLDRLQAKLFRLFDSNVGLRDDLTFSVCEDIGGRMWLANRDGGVARVTNGDVEVMWDRLGWPNASAARVFPVGKGGIWFCGGTGLFKTDAAGEEIQKIEPTPLRNIRVMFASRQDELWLAGDAGDVGRLSRTGFTQYGIAAGFPRQQAFCFAEDAEDRILVGTGDGQLFRLNDSRFESLRPAGSVALAPVRALLVDKDGVIWVATAGGGLDVIVGGADHFLTVAHGLPDGVISQMLFDDRGSVWFGSAHGIFRIDRREIMEFVAGQSKSVHASTYGKNEGFEHISCLDGSQPNCWKGRDGTLWFTTRRGVMAIDPLLVRSARKPPVVIDEVRVDETVQPRGPVTKIQIRSDAHRIEFRFSVLNFTAPERVSVRYRLENFDRDWIEAGAERKAVYPRLQPGNYRLQIAADDDEGGWSETGAVLSIAVIPFWWQTLAFRLGGGAVLLALLIAGVRASSHRRLRLKLDRLEREAAVDRERTRIARDIHDELGASLTRISLLSQSGPPAAATDSDRRCFDEIYTTTTAITRSIDEIVWAIDARHDNLDSMVSYFDSHAQGFLSVAKIRYRFNAPDHLPDLTVSGHVRHDLFLAFKEALNNCVKYAGATEVTVYIDATAERLKLTVSDNGCGLPNGNGSTPGAQPRAGGGNGLNNIAARLATLGGESLVYSGKNGGTDVVLVLPLGMLAN